MASTTLGSTNSTSSSGSKVWEKTVKDANNIDEVFTNARDIGYVRSNQYRTTLVGKMAKYDSSDLYKIKVLSNAKLTMTLRSVEDSKDTSTDSLTSETSNEDSLLNMTSSGLRVQVYTLKSNGKEVLVGDSSASEGSKKYETIQQMLTGDYKAKKGDLYIKITRDDGTSANAEIPYALQLSQGKAKHDYIVTETASDDTKNKKITKSPSVSSTSTSLSTISASSALQIMASLNQGASDMLSVGYANMAKLYAKNSEK
ncbi:MAG: hypothetical protein ACK5N8_08470 [Alphaproteobacteria bacterium]